MGGLRCEEAVDLEVKETSKDWRRLVDRRYRETVYRRGSWAQGRRFVVCCLLFVGKAQDCVQLARKEETRKKEQMNAEVIDDTDGNREMLSMRVAHTM